MITFDYDPHANGYYAEQIDKTLRQTSDIRARVGWIDGVGPALDAIEALLRARLEEIEEAMDQ